ncbi:MAG: non-homologous end-joining DNA ligase [Deltaproteobacteria bacterium]|nr:non-homologous end-joining DNA ligase [Deltaproteobacteria bacterium]
MTPAEKLAVDLGAPIAAVDARKVSPMLCERDDSGERILTRAGWTYELKLDGVRIVADKRGGDVRLSYRRSRDATSSYAEVCDSLRALAEERVVLDGEVVAFDDDGRPHFQRLGTRIQTRGTSARARASVPVAFVVFDILAIGDRDLRRLPIEARRAILDLVLDGRETPGLKLHPRFTDGKALFAKCQELGLEGVVAKRAQSVYVMDRSSEWVKIKCEMDAELVVVGWCEGEGRRSRLGALDVASYSGGELWVRGRVGSGLDEDTIDVLLERLAPLEVPRAVAKGKYEPKKVRHHVRPELVVSIRHGGFSDGGTLRFPVFRGIREDVRPEDCRHGETGDLGRRVPMTSATAVVLADGRTKGDVAAHYERVAPRLLPLAKGRLLVPLSVDPARRFGLAPLWPLPPWRPSWVRVASIARGPQEVRGMLAEEPASLLFAVEAGAVSFAMTSAREDDPGVADFVAFEVTGEGGAKAGAVATSVESLVRDVGLSAFRHDVAEDHVALVVPVGRARWEAARAFATLIEALLGPEATSKGARLAAFDTPILPLALVPPRDAAAKAEHDWEPWLRMFEAEPDLVGAVSAIERFVR